MSETSGPRKMSPLVAVPRDSLAELLQRAGSSQTPEEFVAALPEIAAYSKYAGRATAAAWSKIILYVVVAFGAMITVFSFCVENVIVLIGLAIVAFFENRVHRGFKQGDPGAPDLGFRNQACFAAGILIYGLYHATTVGSSLVLDEFHDAVDTNMLVAIQLFMRGFYLLIGVVGGVSQFWMAWYYLRAKVTVN